MSFFWYIVWEKFLFFTCTWPVSGVLWFMGSQRVTKSHKESDTTEWLTFIFTMIHFISVQFNSVAQSCPTLYDPTNRSTPGLPVHHQLPEFTQRLLKFMSIESMIPSNHLTLSHPLLLLPSIFYQHQGLFQWVSCLHQVAKLSELQHQSF